jgi:hypothetical protein
MGPYGLFTPFVTFFAVVKTLVFVDMFPLKHQQAPSLTFIGGPIGGGTRTQAEE